MLMAKWKAKAKNGVRSAWCLSLACVAVFLFLPISATAQEDSFVFVAPTPKVTPKSTPKPAPKPKPMTSVDSASAPSGPGPASSVGPAGAPGPVSMPTPPSWIVKKQKMNESSRPAERSIAVDAKVSISMCVTDGPVKINGWSRNEVRAYVDGGTEVGFKSLRPDPASGKSVWVHVLAFDPKKNGAGNFDECLAGDDIQVDVPYTAIVKIKSKAGDITIDSISKTAIESISGDITIRNIKQGADVSAFEGNVRLESVSGSIDLLSSAGKIVVFEAAPNEIGDVFRAKSRSGSITLQKVEHADVEVSSPSGNVRFIGEIVEGGQYKYNTTNGAVIFNLPNEVSCTIEASYVNGAFETQIPFKYVYKDTKNQVQKVKAVLGEGDASIVITTFNGTILIRPIKK
jgi:hypothetical protein